MAKTFFPQSNMSDRHPLDVALRPGRRAEVAGDSVYTDPDNIMDNWYLSAQVMRRQKISKDPHEVSSWNARKELDPGGYDLVGSWHYSRSRDSKTWKQDGLMRRPAIRFSAHRGDLEISAIHRQWAEGHKRDFINTIYNKYSDLAGMIPEATIWRIFRCLVEELVPENEKWTNAPQYLIENPNTIWQVAKCIFHILTRGRFWSDESNAINPLDDGRRFGEYKQNFLQKHYSKNLMKYVLACLSVDETKRYGRHELLEHFNKVLSILARIKHPERSYRPEPAADDSLLAPYISINPLIPNGFTREEGVVYEKLLDIVARRNELAADGKQRIPHIVIVTDLAKDYDDLLALMCLKELHRLGVVHIEGFVANLMPADKRALFGRGALDSLGYPEIEIAIGTIGDAKRRLDQHSHEFDNTESFMASPDTVLPGGQELLEKIFAEVPKTGNKITVLTISSLMDMAQFAENHGELLKSGVANVVLQGGYRIIKGVLTADFAAQNNKFDEEGANMFHAFMQENEIHSTAWTKVAATAVPLYNTLFEFLERTGHPLGPYLRKVQVKQDVNFYERACSDHPYAPYMTQEWYVQTKSTWFAAGHEPDEDYPIGEDMVPYFTKVVAYDALAAVGSAGDDVLQTFGIIKPIMRRTDVDDKTHSLVGIPAVNRTENQPALSQEENLDAEAMGVVITALLKGSILAKLQGLGGAAGA